MAIPRKLIVDDSQSGFYHCVSRTVRQSFILALDGDPELDGMDPDDPAIVVDDHRRDWVVERLATLSQVFAIDCVTSAVMSNHLHLLLRTLPELVTHWSDAEVAYRWLMLHPPRWARRRQKRDPDSAPFRDEVEQILGDADRVKELRERLSSLSWYMKELKEWLSRKANREEGRTGAFWEERFSSFPALSDSAVLLCASYIDLNPVAARVATDPLSAVYTGVQAHVGRAAREGNPGPQELWRRLVADGHVSDDDAENLASMFDGALFTSAVPARREPYGVADSWGLSTAGELDDVDEGTGDGGSVGSEPAVADRPLRRLVPAVPLLGMTLGDYLRRLRMLSDLARAGGDRKREEKREERERREALLGREVDVAAISELAVSMSGEAPERAMAVLGAMLRAPKLRGTAIGDAASLAAEAKRRGNGRGLMAMRGVVADTA